MNPLMNGNGNGSAAARSATTAPAEGDNGELHPAWQVFLHFCRQLRHGEIEKLKIQDGLPVLAEVTRQKIKFAP